MQSGPSDPIFIVGTQRSGTTLLQSLLGAHPRIAAPPEVHFWFRIRLLEEFWGDLQDDANLLRVVRALLNSPVDVFQGAGFEEERLFARVASGPRTLPALLDALLSDFAERHGKARWSEKSPGQTASQAVSMFPDAQLIHIVRDPFDVVASNLRLPWNAEDAYQLACSWRDFNMDAIAVGNKVGPRQYLRVRYEDLSAEPDSTLRLVCAHLREQFDPEVLADDAARSAFLHRGRGVGEEWHQRLLEPIRPTVGRAASLGRLRRARIASVVNDLMLGLGYPRSSLPARMVGRAANLALQPRYLPGKLRLRAEARRAQRDPEQLARLVDRYLQTKAEAVEGLNPRDP